MLVRHSLVAAGLFLVVAACSSSSSSGTSSGSAGAVDAGGSSSGDAAPPGSCLTGADADLARAVAKGAWARMQFLDATEANPTPIVVNNCSDDMILSYQPVFAFYPPSGPPSAAADPACALLAPNGITGTVSALSQPDKCPKSPPATRCRLVHYKYKESRNGILVVSYFTVDENGVEAKQSLDLGFKPAGDHLHLQGDGLSPWGDYAPVSSGFCPLGAHD